MSGEDSNVVEECVLRILEHGDIKLMSAYTVRNLAAQETGLDLSGSYYRQLVERVLRDYFNKESDPKPSDSVKRKISLNPLHPVPSQRPSETVEKRKEEILPKRKPRKNVVVKKDAPLRSKADEMRKSSLRNGQALQSPALRKKKRQLILDEEDDD